VIATISPDDPALGLMQTVREDGTLAPGLSLPDPALLTRMLREMLRVRLIDEKMLGKQRQGKIGFFGTVTGQEAVPVAAGLAVTKEDWVFPALREGAIMLVRGFPLSQWLAQVYGNEADVLKGRQMPSHMSGRSVNQVSWSSCIGPQIPQAVGTAMAAKYKKDPIVTLGFLGDGATSEPDFHTAMNFAAVYKAPCVIVCQNNHWSISVPTALQTASQTIAIKAHAYGMPGVRVDGNDVVAVHRVLRGAIERARRGEGPTFVEAVTYRMGPHSSSDDPTRYRSNEEVEGWKAKDPIKRLEALVLTQRVLDADAIQTMRREIGAEIERAIQEVEELPPPARQTLFEDVFGTQPWHLREQAAEHEQTWQTRATTSS
jgi:pyruvate dehydrogenase E1 component alpha subunit/2-oxoisovalerate dehydrogenase E1 component alpha subunit